MKIESNSISNYCTSRHQLPIIFEPKNDKLHLSFLLLSTAILILGENPGFHRMHNQTNHSHQHNNKWGANLTPSQPSQSDIAPRITSKKDGMQQHGHTAIVRILHDNGNNVIDGKEDKHATNAMEEVHFEVSHGERFKITIKYLGETGVVLFDYELV